MRSKSSTNLCLFQARRLSLLSKKLLFIGTFILGIQLLSFAQERSITGTVRSDAGEALPGVNILVKGTTTGTTTGADGKYTLQAPGNATLVFSYIGYKFQEIAVGNQTNIDVTMAADVQSLSEVVVTAFGIEKQKKAVGFAVQELGQKDLTDAREVNAANYLTGKIAGVQVSRTASGTGGSTKVIIRGISSLTGENQPLYVVDGVPLDNTRYNEANVFGAGKDFGDGIGNLNPQDIESMTVLKGPNATALYGSRGSNGVILITTKSGKAGKGIGVEINSNTTMEKLNLIPNLQNKYGPGYEDQNVYGSIVNINGQPYETIESWHSDSYGPPMNGKLFVNPFVFDPTAPPTTFPLLPQPKNNIRDYWETGVVTNNTVALSGGTEKSSARLSFNDTRIKGITPNHTGNQQSINLRVATRITDKLSVDAKVNYIHKLVENAPALGSTSENILWDFATLGRYVPLNFLKEYYEKTGKGGSWPNVSMNPYYVRNELKNTAERDRFISFISLKYQFNSWLSLMARSGIDTYSERRRQTWPVGARGNEAGRLIDETYLTKESNSDILLTASKSNVGNFSLTLSLGAYRLQKSNRMQGWDANTFKIPGVYDIKNAKNIIAYNPRPQKELQSVNFAGQRGYNNYLFLDVTGRNDWSSTLGTGNYSFFYPSVSGSFVFTDAVKMNSNILTFGKVRASYAEAGNDASPFLTESGYSLNSIPFDGQSYAAQSTTIPLFNLKNELKQSVEFGADLRFLNDRFGLDVTYYKSNTKNQIVPIAISSASGYSNKVINAGNIQNKGIEITLRATPVQLGNGFRWDLAFNYAKNQSKVIALAPGIETFLLYSSYPNNIEARVGDAFGNIIGYKYKRSPDGQKIVTADGYYQRKNEYKVLGNTTPKWIGGLNNTFTFKGITLSALIDFVQGNQITSSTRYQMEAKGTGGFSEEGRENFRPLAGVVKIKECDDNVAGYQTKTK